MINCLKLNFMLHLLLTEIHFILGENIFIKKFLLSKLKRKLVKLFYQSSKKASM